MSDTSERSGQPTGKVERELADEKETGKPVPEGRPGVGGVRAEAKLRLGESSELNERAGNGGEPLGGVETTQRGDDRLDRCVGVERLADERKASAGRKRVEEIERGAGLAEEARDLVLVVAERRLRERLKPLGLVVAERRATAGERLERVTLLPLGRDAAGGGAVEEEVLAELRPAMAAAELTVDRLGGPASAEGGAGGGDEDAAGQIQAIDERGEVAGGILPDDDAPLVEELRQTVADVRGDGPEIGRRNQLRHHSAARKNRARQAGVSVGAILPSRPRP